MRPMTFRFRIFITTVVLCHLFLAPSWLISQLRGGTEKLATPNAPANAAPTGPIQPSETVTIKARQQEKQGDIYKLTGEAEIDFRDYVFRADEMTYNSDTGEITANGNISFNGGPHDEHLSASSGHYNVNTDSGVFFNVVGSTGAKIRGRGVVLTSSNPFLFSGKEVEQQGRDKIIVRHGMVTSCRLPRPKWTFNSSEVTVVPGENARLHNSTFHLFGLPIFYLPFLETPVERPPRQTGFLLPHIGQSSVKGTIIGEGFYWAINRSMDATIGAEYFSRRGWSQRGEFRAKPSESSYVDFSYFGVLDRGLPTSQVEFIPGEGNVLVAAHQDQGGQDAQLNAESPLPYGFRGVASIDYLSSFLFRAAFSEHFTEAINSEVRSTAFASRSRNGYSFNVMGSRYQNFQSTSKGDLITIVHAPSFEASSVDRRIKSSPFYFSYDAAIEGLSRREPNFVTGNAVGRFDLTPTVAMPVEWKGWKLRPELSLHETYYTESLVPSTVGLGTPSGSGVNRRAIETAFEILPPSLSKVFDRPVFNHKIKHTVEPQITYRMVSGVNNFENILRFDARDVLSDTNEVEYSLVNRLYSKPAPKPECKDRTDQPGCEAPAAHEVLSWEVAQKYFIDPNFGGALVSGRRNVFTTTAEFTGIAFLTEPRRFSPIISRLRASTGSKADVDWQLDYDLQKGRISSSTELVTYRFLNQFGFSAGHSFLQNPGEVFVTQPIVGPSQFNQFRLQLNYGNINRRGLNLAGVAGYDAIESYLQYSAVQASYNWDCCGMTFEYRRFNFGNVRDETQYRFALTLSNLGTFGTLRKQERLF